MIDMPELLIGGQRYGGWLTFNIERKIDDACSFFDFAVTERWPGQTQAWPIAKFTPCEVMLGADLLLTGYVDAYLPEISDRAHHVRITGRSKTADLIDCEPDIAAGQFTGYTLLQIARTVCAIYGIQVVDLAGSDQVFADASLQRCETAFKFLERLGRLSGVLLTDDEMGRLVLTRTGSVRATTRIQEGVNVLTARGKFDGARQYSIYIVKGQRGLGGGGKECLDPEPGGDDDDAEGLDDYTSPASTPKVETALRAVATDSSVPRYRSHVTMAESMLDQAGMQQRADWQARYAAGRAAEIDVSLRGFRQDDGSLWRFNTTVSCTIPRLGVDADLLIAHVSYKLDDKGPRVDLLLAPPDAYAPDPGEVKLHRHRAGRKGKATGLDLTGVGSA